MVIQYASLTEEMKKKTKGEKKKGVAVGHVRPA